MQNKSKPDFIKMEHEVLQFWKERQCFKRLRRKNKGNKRFRFLDGPITANNPMGIHHAWGRSVKDAILRYKAMNGYDCLYQNGFDTQGLWVEVEVEKELGFRNKKEIEAYGVDRFTQRCVERVKKYADVIESQSKRLGQWMDWENSYFTHTDENISAIWSFLKICHKNGWIIQSSRPMPWCPRCGTSLSEHEMSGSYMERKHTAVFAIAPVKEADFDLLVWTTTPWTLTANAALAVNPELDYLVVRNKEHPRPLVLAKNALRHMDGETQALKQVMGGELIGLEYETFFPWLPVQRELAHKVVPWNEVDANEGSGIVHIAPGCGLEDYELGKAFSLAEICPIDENGDFKDDYGFLSHKPANQAASHIINKLEEAGRLFKAHKHTHSYPVCWRCKTEVLYRLVSEWYIQTDEIRPKLIQAAKTVTWNPPFIGKRMEDWLINMGDWNISRKRYYGLPLPFYPCNACGHLTVIGSKEELLELGGNAAHSVPELHRPWIDDVSIRCPGCGATVSRITEVGDVWLDAGIVPFSTLGYFSNREEWERHFPAEWVIEMQEQVRLWFYSQLFMSVTITGHAPYERVQTYNWVLAEDGKKFSKTGYMIRFDEAAEEIGSDAIRYLFAGTPMANDVRFGFELGGKVRRRLLGFLNIHSFFLTYAEIDKPNIARLDLVKPESDHLMDTWLNHRIRDFVSKSVRHYEAYDLPEIVREFEICVDDVSNWYIRLNRRRFWKQEQDTDKQNAYYALYHAIKTMTQVMAPIIPFMAERVWQDLVLLFGCGEESVHLSDFPKATFVNADILQQVKQVRMVMARALKLRNEKNLKVKQPLSKLYLDEALKDDCTPFHAEIMDEVNIKEIVYLTDFHVLNQQSTAFHPQTKPRDDFLIAIDLEITDDLKMEGLYRELLRHCQVLRKEAGFNVSDRVTLDFETDSPLLSSILQTYGAKMMRETLSRIQRIDEPLMQKVVPLDGTKLVIKILS